jgi:hypothetical protein
MHNYCGEQILATVFPNPVSCVNMVRVGSLLEACGFRLFGGEKPDCASAIANRLRLAGRLIRLIA